jgi:hypothetical protein
MHKVGVFILDLMLHILNCVGPPDINRVSPFIVFDFIRKCVLFAKDVAFPFVFGGSGDGGVCCRGCICRFEKELSGSSSTIVSVSKFHFSICSSFLSSISSAPTEDVSIPK